MVGEWVRCLPQDRVWFLCRVSSQVWAQNLCSHSPASTADLWALLVKTSAPFELWARLYPCRARILSLGRAYGWAEPSPQAALAWGTPCCGYANLWELLVLLGMGGGERRGVWNWPTCPKESEQQMVSAAHGEKFVSFFSIGCGDLRLRTARHPEQNPG